MLLKKIDMSGFKSFADKTSLDFTKGVTAVVGPNGSGKSNIADAVRWVLGEQSAKSLRGAKMEDIIFGGSDSRKPINFAEVTITLDNQSRRLPIEYSEVAITRRVHRNGESDFFINKQPCRLKDIVDLIMDSGLGKEAFSIIGQGRVEEILSSKPEERRGIFEEAAGVLKYKTRKKKAEDKLTETRDNLNRVEDIIYELSSQIEPLKEQSSIANQYLELQEELEKVEVALIVHEIEDLHSKWEQLKKQLQVNQEQEILLSTGMSKQEATLVISRNEMTKLDELIQVLQEKLMDTTNEIEKLEGKKNVLRERKQNATEYAKQLEETLAKLTENMESNQLEVRVVATSLGEWKKQMAELKRTLQKKETELIFDSMTIDETIENLKGDYIEKLNEQATYRNELSMLTDQLARQGTKNAKLEQENEKYLSLRKELLVKKEPLEEKLTEIETLLSQARADFIRLQREIKEKKASYDNVNDTLQKAYQFLQQAKSRKEMLEAMEEDYTGFYQGVREVLKAREEITGIEGAIAELITVPKPYHTALEIALGASMQHIVVLDEQKARNAIAYLRKNRYGRATFLPLSVIKGKNIPDHVRQTLKQAETFVGVAAELVQVENRYRQVVESLLGTVLVVKDLAGANQLAKVLGYRYRLVTLEGDVVNPGGSMSGGATRKEGNSLLARQQELEEITTKLSSMEAQTKELEQTAKEEKQELVHLEATLLELQKVGTKASEEEQSIRSAIAAIEAEERVANDRLSMYDLEIAEFAGEQEKIGARKEKLATMLKEIAEEIAFIHEEIERHTTIKTVWQGNRATLEQEVTNLKVSLAETKQKVANEEEQVARLKQIGKELEESYQNNTQELVNLQALVHQSVDKETDASAILQEKKQLKADLLNEIASSRSARLSQGGEVEVLESELKEAVRQHSFLASTLKEQEVAIGRLDVELDNRLNHLQSTYFLTFEGAKEKYPLLLPLEEAKTKVKLTKRSIDELGMVNLGAIEEYERVAERYAFLEEQQADLLAAKDTLHQAISEMDEEMKSRFLHMFTNIREHFHHVFRELFGGGKADIYLTDENDLLHTGIQIIAQPPGKKMQSLSLLSGGERAFTAIALLFSILKVRPVPFCVLDEVEAALDEANVVKFAQYLQRMSTDTQFVVITHRKGTMEESDVLYGVTMQESGVSKLVSVRLEDVEQVG